VLLHVGAADHDAWVWVNGQPAGTHRGGYTPFSLDVTALLKRGENVVTIHCQDDTRSPMVAGGKQCPDYYSRQCHYTRTTGLWQTVWLEAVPDAYVANLRLTPLLESGQLLVEAELGGTTGRGTLELSASLASQAVSRASVPYAGRRAVAVLPVPMPSRGRRVDPRSTTWH
jgi:beta-galactosidase/beta-glucuronidase